jgi:two-component system LytT family response regulator
MPELDGFGVVQQVGPEKMPPTIFVTAYDQYALAAFDTNALDYLLKPFGKARFDRALARARERFSSRTDREWMQALLQSVANGAAQPSYVDRLPVRQNGRIVFVKTKDIQWIQSQGNYAVLHLATSQRFIREPLLDLEKKLDPKEFARIHRSTIVNLRCIKEIQPWFNGYHLVVLGDGQELRMSRYQHTVAERLGLHKPRR